MKGKRGKKERRERDKKRGEGSDILVLYMKGKHKLFFFPHLFHPLRKNERKKKKHKRKKEERKRKEKEVIFRY